MKTVDSICGRDGKVEAGAALSKQGVANGWQERRRRRSLPKPSETRDGRSWRAPHTDGGTNRDKNQEQLAVLIAMLELEVQAKFMICWCFDSGLRKAMLVRGLGGEPKSQI